MSRPPCLLCAALLLAATPLGAQEPSPSEPGTPEQDAAEDRMPFTLETTVVTPTLQEERSFDVPFATGTVSAAQLEERAYRTLPQALRDQPGVMVQETAHGQGSPYIRGFTGYRNLLLIDGIRLNNSVFRPGPNQYWNTVDPMTLERLELVRGPSSVLYGSDAVGGTVNALTRSPWGHAEGPAVHGELRYLWADAENYDQARAELSATYGPEGGVLIGLSSKNFGDIQGGAEVGLQPETGYGETDADMKIVHFLDPTTRVILAHQSVDQVDVPRTHKTIFGTDWEDLSTGSDLQRDLDQRRNLTYFQLHQTELGGFIDSFSASLSHHTQEEQRDRIKSSGDRDLQGFQVDTLGLFTHLSKATSGGVWTWGVDYYRDEVDSFLHKLSGNSAADDIQGPVADDATYDQLGIFVQDQVQVSERSSATLGVRWNETTADAQSVRDPLTDERISIEDSWRALVGSARMTYALVPEQLNLYGGVCQGFRAPNLSDLSRFDSAKSNEFEVPSPDLDPEQYLSFELGMKLERERTSVELALFHTRIEDQILRIPTGETNDEGEFEVTKDNVGDGYVRGIELGLAHALADAWTVFGSLTFVDGRYESYPDSTGDLEESYLDHLMPTTAQAGLHWDGPGRRLWSELVVTHAEAADRLSTRDEGDTSRIPAGGTPGYTVFDLRGGWQLSSSTRAQLGVENLTDEDYRVHGSGLNRPGRNLYVGLAFSF